MRRGIRPRRDDDEILATPGVEAFLEALAGRLGTGPFEGVDVYCTHRIGRVVELRNIGVRGPLGTGRGSAALDALLDLADEADADLHIQPSGNRTTTTERLDGWYRRHGCVDDGQPGRLAYRAGSRSVPVPR